jgi:hypothetical protein
MAQFDINGNHMPEQNSQVQPPPVRYDLAGNPLPPQQPAQPVQQPGSYPQQYSQSGPYSEPNPYQSPYNRQMPSPYDQAPPGGYPQVPPGQSGPQYGQGQPCHGPQAGGRKPLTYFDGKQIRFTDEPKSSPSELAVQWTVGGLLCLAFGILGSIGVMKLSFFLGRGFIALYVFNGAAVGGCARYAAGKGGVTATLLALAVISLGLFCGHLTYTADFMQKYFHYFQGQSVFAALPYIVGRFNGIHWLFVASSAFAAGKVALSE